MFFFIHFHYGLLESGLFSQGHDASVPALFIVLVSMCCCAVQCSVVSDSVTPWTIPHQAPLPLSMEFSSPDCWSGLPFPSPGDLPNPG